MKRKCCTHNRLLPFTGCLSDAEKRLKLAELDMDFIRTLDKCGIDCTESRSIGRIWMEAERQAAKARKQLGRQ